MYTTDYLYDMIRQCLPVTYNYALHNDNLYHIPIPRRVAYY